VLAERIKDKDATTLNARQSEVSLSAPRSAIRCNAQAASAKPRLAVTVTTDP
jgi:hypothetical protein